MQEMLGRKSCQPKQQLQEVGGRQNPELVAEVQYAQRSTSIKCKMLMLAGMAGMTVQAVL
jgi:hypothetical protein